MTMLSKFLFFFVFQFHLPYYLAFRFFIYTEPHPPTNITTTVYCRQGYEIEIDWQVRMLKCVYVLLQCFLNMWQFIVFFYWYELRMHQWCLLQAPLPAPLGSPLIGYLLDYHINGNESIVKNFTATSYTLSRIPPGSVCNITVLALSNAGPSKNNTSIQFGMLDITVLYIKWITFRVQ